MSGQQDKPKIPAPPAPAGGSGNLLSSVAPPSQLPNFLTAPVAGEAPQVVPPAPVYLIPPTGQTVPLVGQTVQPAGPTVPPVGTPAAPLSAVPPQPIPVSMLPPPLPVQPVVVGTKAEDENFSPAIPLSKGAAVPVTSPDSQATDVSESLPDSTPEKEKIGDIMPGSGLLTWVKGAVSSGGILQRVAEKAKSSVDTMITTLDPQMKEYLYSGGDMYIVVASDKDVKISPVREAFQTVFGKATVVGYEAQSEVIAAQPVGYAAAYAAAKQRIAHIRSVRTELNNNIPVVAIESFLHEAVADRWYEINLLVLSQPSLDIELHVQSQGAAVPAACVAAAREATPTDYRHAQTGYCLTVGSIMADSLRVPHIQWQEVSSGVSRREILVLAAKSLAGSYKKMLAVSAAET